MSRRLLVLAVALITLAVFPHVPAGHAPACTNASPVNDCIANATPITTSFVDVWSNNEAATVEPHEPGVGPDNQFTLWWKFTAFRDSDGSFGVGDSEVQSTHSVYELQDDGSFLWLDGASGWTAMPWSYFLCEAGKTYYVQLGGEEGQSGDVNLYGGPCQIGPERPRAPSLSVAPGPGSGEISLAWSLSDDGGAPVTGWHLVRGTVGTCDGAVTVATPEAGTTTFTDAGLAGGPYCYEIAAVNSVGTGDWSSPRVTTPLGPPTTPRFLGATVQGGSSIALAWWGPAYDGGSAVTGFNVLAGPSPEGPWSLIGEPTSPAFTDAGLAPGTVRHYRVTAETGIGEGPAAATSARTWTTPSAPRDVDTGPSIPLGVRVSWAAPADDGGRPVTEYVVLRGDHGQTMRFLARVSGTARSFDDSPPLLNAFDYAVYAVNAQGDSPTSGRVCGEAFPAPPPFETC